MLVPMGKAAALNMGVAGASHDLVVFADAPSASAQRHPGSW